MRQAPVLFLLLLLSVAAQAQPASAVKHFERAMTYMAQKESGKACSDMEEAIKDDPTYTDAYSTLGQWYFDLHQYDKAVDVFSRASKNCPKGNVNFAKPLVKSLICNYQPAEALRLCAQYAPKYNDASWERIKAQALFVSQALAHPLPDTPKNLGCRINTSDPEMFPGISADTQMLYYTRRMNGEDEDFFFSTVDSCGGWFTGRNMGSPPNTPDEESSEYISVDRHYLFFTRCNNRSDNGWEKGGCDLFMAYRVAVDSPWTIGQTFGATINSPGYEGMPCLSADNRELYFASDRPGGYGGLDIWVSRFQNGYWQVPRNLGPRINTAGNETAPFLHPDNNTLYFASTGMAGMGGSDLYYCRRMNDTTWSTPKDLGYPLNTSSDENSICVTPDGQKCYIASDRDSSAGNFDIYEMKLPPALQPVPVGIVKGIVYDSLSKDLLNYASIHILKPNGEELYHFMSNRGDASYMITLPAGINYHWHIDRVGYTSLEDSFTLRDRSTVNYNISLLPSDYVMPVNDSLILTIHFPLNSAKLSDSDLADIRRAMDPWAFEKGIVIYVNGYTDNTGNPMINEQLSFNRANLVTKAITDLGYDPVNIESKGWGEANPVAPNDGEENWAKNRRVEIIIRR
jgi:outer membrane protein OmpA-like peptidoglycan-associated protein